MRLAGAPRCGRRSGAGAAVRVNRGDSVLRAQFLNFTRRKPDGTFAIAGLPAAEYYVAAVDRMQGNEGFGEWQDPAFLNAIAPRASWVILSEGQSASVTLRLIVR